MRRYVSVAIPSTPPHADSALTLQCPSADHNHSLDSAEYNPRRANSSAIGRHARNVQRAISKIIAAGMDRPHQVAPPCSMYLRSSSACLSRLGFPSLWIPPRLLAATRNTRSTE